MREEIERHHTATTYIVVENSTLLLWHTSLRMWLPPGGHCEKNEHPVETAIREAKEETGFNVQILEQPPLLRCEKPKSIEPPRVILLEDIERKDQPFHQHIDHVYFSKPIGKIVLSSSIPHGICEWVNLKQLTNQLSLVEPTGRSVMVAEDVRLLGIQAIETLERLEQTTC